MAVADCMISPIGIIWHGVTLFSHGVADLKSLLNPPWETGSIFLFSGALFDCLSASMDIAIWRTG